MTVQTSAAPVVACHSSANGRELVDEGGGRGVGCLGVGVGGSAPLRAIAAALLTIQELEAEVDSRRDRASSMSAAPPGSPSSRPSPTARRRADTPGRSAPAGDEARARGTDIGGGGHDDGEDAKKDKEDHERLKRPYVAIGETMRLSEGEGDAMEYF